MIYYAYDRKWTALGFISLELPGAINYTDDIETQDIETGSKILSIDIIADDSKWNKAKAITSPGNYWIAKDKETNIDDFYTVMNREYKREENKIIVYLEGVGLDLLNEIVGKWDAPKNAQKISYYIDKVLTDTGFEIGINEISDRNRTLSWDGESTSYKRLLSIATQFDVELMFRSDIQNNIVKHKYVDIYKKIGNDTKVELRVDRDINSITVKESIEDLVTALKPSGSTAEGQEKAIDLNGYILTKEQSHNGRFVVSGDKLLDIESNKIWSRYLNPNEQGNGQGYIVGSYTSEATSQKTLADESIAQLIKKSQAQINYEVDITKLPKSSRLGDIIYLVDDKDELYLETRILKLERSRANQTYTATLGDFLIVSSGISQQLQELADKVSNVKSGDTFYPWVRYADDINGKNMSSMPLNKKYIAIKYVVNQPIPSDDPTVYKEHWTKIGGENGKDGSPGENGETKYTWMMYADDVNGKNMSSDAKGKSFLGLSYNRDTKTPSNLAKDYTWSAMYDTAIMEDVEKRLKEVNSTTISTTEPQSPTTGDNWWQSDGNGDITGIFKWDGTEWKSTQIQQDSLIIKQLTSVAIDSAQITGSKIINTFKDVELQGEKLTGTTTVEGANVRIDYKTANGQSGNVVINPLSTGSQVFNSQGVKINGYELSTSQLYFYDKDIGTGVTEAKYLVQYPWWWCGIKSGFSWYNNTTNQYRPKAKLVFINNMPFVNFFGILTRNSSGGGGGGWQYWGTLDIVSMKIKDFMTADCNATVSVNGGDGATLGLTQGGEIVVRTPNNFNECRINCLMPLA